MASKLNKVIAPEVSEFGGGIDKAVIGETTDRYEQYFEEKSTEQPEELKKKRLINYKDVVVRRSPAVSTGITLLFCLTCCAEAAALTLQRRLLIAEHLLRPRHVLLRVRMGWAAQLVHLSSQLAPFRRCLQS